jgi:uncharacterized protein YecE (DUF72 family)
MSEFRIGTSAFTAADWLGSFYPEGAKQKDFLTYYATKFSTVEQFLKLWGAKRK